jgi:hypothetical protein
MDANTQAAHAKRFTIRFPSADGRLVFLLPPICEAAGPSVHSAVHGQQSMVWITGSDAFPLP